jgi:hypothetical protein
LLWLGTDKLKSIYNYKKNYFDNKIIFLIFVKMLIMKKIISFLILMILSFNLYSQYIPIKDGKNKETIFQDLVFSKMIEELKLNLLDYNIVNISEIVRFRDSLIIKKISYDIYNVDITYKTLDNLNINQYRSEVKYNSTKSKKTKLLMCFRTLIPDNKNNYKINFFILEGY